MIWDRINSLPFNRLSCTTRCPVPHVVLFHRLSCSTGCPVLHVVLFHTLSCSTRCPVPHAVLFHRLSCTTRCPVPHVVLFHTLSCSTGCPILKVRNVISFTVVQIAKPASPLSGEYNTCMCTAYCKYCDFTNGRDVVCVHVGGCGCVRHCVGVGEWV